MVAIDENALICDFAETYHIFRWRDLPARYAAVLAAGLRPNSRIAMKLGKSTVPMDLRLMAVIADACQLRVWQNSQAAFKGESPPGSILQTLMGKPTKKQNAAGFANKKDFDAWRKSMLRGDANA